MKHQHISFTKSGFRILGYTLLLMQDLSIAAGLLVFSELLGIVEEIGHE